MQSQRSRRSPGTAVVESADPGAIRTTIEGVLIRNHDQDRGYTCQISVRDPYGDTVCDRTVSVGPAATTSLELELGRGVYAVEAVHDAAGPVSSDCLISGDPAEHASIETGNGAISVTDVGRPS